MAASKLSPEERKKQREHRQQLRNAAQAILSAPMPIGSQGYDTLDILGIKDPTMADLLVLAQFEKACKGNTEAAKFIRDTAGEKPDLIIAAPKYDADASPDMLKGMTDDQLQEWIDQRNTTTQESGAEADSPEPASGQLCIFEAEFGPV